VSILKDKQRPGVDIYNAEYTRRWMIFFDYLISLILC